VALDSGSDGSVSAPAVTTHRATALSSFSYPVSVNDSTDRGIRERWRMARAVSWADEPAMVTQTPAAYLG
jgi:hypothetical protein